jgi:hypothetical protein
MDNYEVIMRVKKRQGQNYIVQCKSMQIHPVVLRDSLAIWPKKTQHMDYIGSFLLYITCFSHTYDH